MEDNARFSKLIAPAGYPKKLKAAAGKGDLRAMVFALKNHGHTGEEAKRGFGCHEGGPFVHSLKPSADDIAGKLSNHAYAREAVKVMARYCGFSDEDLIAFFTLDEDLYKKLEDSVNDGTAKMDFIVQKLLSIDQNGLPVSKDHLPCITAEQAQSFKEDPSKFITWILLKKKNKWLFGEAAGDSSPKLYWKPKPAPPTGLTEAQIGAMRTARQRLEALAKSEATEAIMMALVESGIMSHIDRNDIKWASSPNKVAMNLLDWIEKRDQGNRRLAWNQICDDMNLQLLRFNYTQELRQQGTQHSYQLKVFSTYTSVNTTAFI